MPASIFELGDWNAIYEKIPGWRQDTQESVTFGGVPNEMQTFIRILENKCKMEVSFVSTSELMEQGMLRVRHG